MQSMKRRFLRFASYPAGLLMAVAIVAPAGFLAAQALAPKDQAVADALKMRLKNTKVDRVDCSKTNGLCEVTAGSQIFYVDPSGRFLVIGRVYDMETRQDLTAARLLEVNPDMLVGAAAGRADGRAAARDERVGERAVACAAEGQVAAVRVRALGDVEREGDVRRSQAACARHETAADQAGGARRRGAVAARRVVARLRRQPARRRLPALDGRVRLARVRRGRAVPRRRPLRAVRARERGRDAA